MNNRDIKVIDIIFQSERGETLTSVCEKSGLPLTTIHRTLNKLEKLRVLSKAGDRFVLGPVIVRWMNAEHKKQRYVDIIHPHLVNLSNEIQETVHLVQRIGQSAFYIDKVEGSGPIALKSKIGNELKLYQTGAGRAIMMLFSKEELEAYLGQEDLVATTDCTVTDPEKLKQQVREFKDQGYALEVEQNEKNIQCIGVPFRIGNIFLSISVTATLLDSTEKLKSFSVKLKETVKAIEGEFQIYE